MRSRSAFTILAVALTALALFIPPCGSALFADDNPPAKKPPEAKRPNPAAVLTDAQWKQLDRAVDDGLKFLVTQHQPDGSFKCDQYGQPAITSLAILAFLSRGHVPEQGPHGKRIHDAIEFVLSNQQPNGLIFAPPPGPRAWGNYGVYNHAISGVMLTEVYGMAGPTQQEAIRKAIEKAIEYTRGRQRQEKSSDDFGGWRYLDRVDSDLSVTGWQLMFYRSAKNAEFDIPEPHIKEALAYVERCFDYSKGTFFYTHSRPKDFGRGMAGAGILSLSLAGKHDTKMAERAAKYILDHPFSRFNRGGQTTEDRFYYGAYYCSQGMYQLGGPSWEPFYSVLLKTMAENQRPDGSWPNENHEDDRQVGEAYTTAFAILSLTPPYQLLPIYQR